MGEGPQVLLPGDDQKCRHNVEYMMSQVARITCDESASPPSDLFPWENPRDGLTAAIRAVEREQDCRWIMVAVRSARLATPSGEEKRFQP